MKKKRIFLTGGDGFIGKHIIEQLGKKYDFVFPSHTQLELLDANSVEKYMKKHGPFDVVVHAANVGGSRRSTDSTQIVDINLRMFFNVARNQKYIKKFVSLGSGAEYAKQVPIELVTEEDFDKRIPADYYGFSKYVITKFIEGTDKFVNLRIFGIWGKYEDWQVRFISNAICKTIFNLPISMNQNVFFTYIQVDDFIRIIDYFINHKSKYRTYNVGGARIDLLTIAKKVKKICGNNFPIKIKRPGLANEYSSNATRLIRELGNFKYGDFDQQVAQLYKWYLKNKSQINKKSLV